MIALVAILTMTLLAAAPATAQQLPEKSNFDRILAAGAMEQIPWEVSVSSPELNLEQRLAVSIAVRLDAARLNKHGSQHELLLLARVASEGGDWVPGTTRLYQRLDEPLAQKSELVFSMKLLVRPGILRVGIVLLDRLSGHRSVTVQPLRVNALQADPLPQLFDGLPAAEIVRVEEGTGEIAPPYAGSQPRLRVETARPVQIEVIVNFGFSEEFSVPRLVVAPQRSPLPGQVVRRTRSVPRAGENIAITLAALKPLAGFTPSNGSLRVTGLDLTRPRVVFEQAFDEPLDWTRLHDSLADIDSNVIDVQTLAGQSGSPAFFRDLLEQRLRTNSAVAGAAPAVGDTSSGQAASRAGLPLRVFVVLSGATLFVRGAKITPVRPPADCVCKVYHLRLFLLGNIFDELEEVIDPLKPRRFDIRSPMDYRKALSTILEELANH